MTLLNQLKQKIRLNPAEPTIKNAQIRVIGDRASGKTTYMTALAYWPNANPKSPVQSVTATEDSDSKDLIRYARNVLEKGLDLEPSELMDNLDDVKDYGLDILLKDQYSCNPTQLGSPPIRLNLKCKDYAGEFFADLIYKTTDPHLKNYDPKLKDYLEDCISATGILLLFDGTSHRLDKKYAQGLEIFLQQLKGGQSPLEQRIAFVINKCELHRLWGSRHEPKTLADNRFPYTMETLEKWANGQSKRADYFTVSAFGVLDENGHPEPNTVTLAKGREGTRAIIRESENWRPFGLVSPIYWLCTSKRHQKLDKD